MPRIALRLSLFRGRAHNLRIDSQRDTSPRKHKRTVAFWALSFLVPNADVSHARPLRAVMPELASEVAKKVKITPNFSFAKRNDGLERGPVSVGEQRNAALARQVAGEFDVRRGELFVASRLAPALGGAVPPLRPFCLGDFTSSPLQLRKWTGKHHHIYA
jgi:hypothetical protein